MQRNMNLETLPQDCIAQILSCTSPRDACRLSLVSTFVRDAAELEVVWEKFLPSDYWNIVVRSISPVIFKSRKELFLKLSGPLLIDDGKKLFSIDKSRNKICYMLGARELSITWASNPLYWSWKPFLASRFPEVAELIMVTWLDIQGKINTKILSPNTTYAAYLVIKLAHRAYGLDTLPSEVVVEADGHFKYRGSTSLKLCQGTTCVQSQEIDAQGVPRDSNLGEERVLHERKDGWLEIELGEFYNGGSEKEVKMSLREVKGNHLKGGLIVEGIEIRPK